MVDHVDCCHSSEKKAKSNGSQRTLIEIEKQNQQMFWGGFRMCFEMIQRGDIYIYNPH